MKPISPSAAKKSLPDEVIAAFNELIEENLRGGEAVVSQDGAVKRVLSKLRQAGKDVTRDHVFAKGWLDIEDTYRAAGWHVEYDSPGYNETYQAKFIFRRKRCQ